MDLMTARYHIPTRVERNAVCALFEEYTRHDLPDTGLVYLDQDVNFSILLDKTILMSNDHYDIGHFVVKAEETERTQGQGGRLKDYASMEGIHKRTGVPFEVILSDPARYHQVFDDCGYYLGLALYNAYLTFRFKKVLFVGRLAEHFDLFQPQLTVSFNRLMERKDEDPVAFSLGLQANSAEAAAYVGIDGSLELSLV